MSYLDPQQAYLHAEGSYLEEKVNQASRIELICLLYEGAIDGLKQARAFLAQGALVPRGRAISRVQAILIELLQSLNHDDAQDISRRLTLLYDYMLTRLNDGLREQSQEPLQEVEGLLVNLLDSWRQCESQAPPETSELQSVSFSG